MFNSVSLDAKLQFINSNIDMQKIDTVIIGSSMALNNINGEILEKNSKKHLMVLNAGAWGLSAEQVEQLLPLLTAHSNIKNIIYAISIGDFTRADRLKSFDSKLLGRYIDNKLSILDRARLITYSIGNYKSFFKNIMEWHDVYDNQVKYTSLKFDTTGSVALNIYGNNIRKSRWNEVNEANIDDHSYEVLLRMINYVHSKKQNFYVVITPYRKDTLDKSTKLKNSFLNFQAKIAKTASMDNAYFIDMHEKMNLPAEYFVDYAHLNNQGSEKLSILLDGIIDSYK
jgi:hypothetical protein